MTYKIDHDLDCNMEIRKVPASEFRKTAEIQAPHSAYVVPKLALKKCWRSRFGVKLREVLLNGDLDKIAKKCKRQKSVAFGGERRD